MGSIFKKGILTLLVLLTVSHVFALKDETLNKINEYGGNISHAKIHKLAKRDSLLYTESLDGDSLVVDSLYNDMLAKADSLSKVKIYTTLSLASGKTTISVSGYDNGKNTSYTRIAVNARSRSLCAEVGIYGISADFTKITSPFTAEHVEFADTGAYVMLGRHLNIIPENKVISLGASLLGGVCFSVEDKKIANEENIYETKDKDNYGLCGKVGVTASLLRFTVLWETNIKFGDASAHYNSIFGFGINF